jgi:hypothetical protein
MFNVKDAKVPLAVIFICFICMSFFCLYFYNSNQQLRKENVAQYNKDAKALEYHRYRVKIRDYAIDAYSEFFVVAQEKEKPHIELRIKHLREAAVLYEENSHLWMLDQKEFREIQTKLIKRQEIERNALDKE